MEKTLKELWGIELLRIDGQIERSWHCEQAAILLGVNEKNYARFEKMPLFGSLLGLLGLELNKYNVQNAQMAILRAVSELKIRRDELALNLLSLKNARLLENEYFLAINEYLSALNLSEIKLESKAQSSFHKDLESLNQIAKSLEIFCENELQTRLKSAVNNANNATFNVAVSGVINAGKSSLLNALIGKDLLGVSNIPQTASICELKYSKDPFASVEFWGQDEQKELGLEPKTLEKKEISLETLKDYTSAESELAKYVKLATLGLDAEILKDINIIDTPGIDDAIKSREELSANYLKNCDATLYLMNAAQAASAKDMEFLKNIVKNTKNSEIIVLLTHIDKLAQNERLSALEYTKKSIEQDFGGNLKPKYFMISAPSKIGINELKAHLIQSFFEGDKKTKLVLESYKKELGFIANLIICGYNDMLKTLGLESNELAKELALNKERQKQILDKLSIAKAQINELKASLQSHKSDNSNDIASIASKTADRLLADLRYAKSSSKKLDLTRFLGIASSGLNDFVIDLLREQKQALENRLLGFGLNLQKLFSEFSFELPDFKKYLDNANFALDISKLKNALVSLANANESLEAKSAKLKALLSQFLLSQDLEGQVKELLALSIESFSTAANSSLNELEIATLQSSQKIQDLITNADEKGADWGKQKEKLLENLAEVSAIKERLEQC